MLPQQRQYAQARLRWMITESHGNQFEELFHKLMELSCSDYVRVAAWGNLGDEGADGLGLGDGVLYACYAPETVDLAKVRAKFRSDLAKAIEKRGGQFKKFAFVHNSQRGIHPQVTRLLAEAVPAHPDLSFAELGPARMWHRAMELSVPRMEELLGESMPVNPVVYRVGMADIELLLRHLAENRTHGTATGPIPVPSPLKADYNGLSARSKEVFQRARPFTYQVQALLDALPHLALDVSRLPDPEARRLFDAYELQLTYSRPREDLTLQVTLRAATIEAQRTVALEVAQTIGARPQAGVCACKTGVDTKVSTPDHGTRAHRGEPRMDARSAPGRIRTYAPASGGRCSIP